MTQRLERDPDAPAGELLGAHDYADCASLAEWVEQARTRWRRRRAEVLAMMASIVTLRSMVCPTGLSTC